MHRRQLLRLTGVGVLGGLAGCSAGYTGTPEESDTTAAAGVPDLPVSGEELRTMVAPDQIAAITEPAFATDWSGLDVPDDAELPGLIDETAVIGIERDGRTRAYPLAVLDWHEVVNDEFGGPLLVTTSPARRSSSASATAASPGRTRIRPSVTRTSSTTASATCPSS